MKHTYMQGDIILVKFPFSDLTSQKLRPALVISNTTFNTQNNLLLVGIYGNEGDPSYAREMKQDMLAKGVMRKQSRLRFQNIFSAHHTLIAHKIGVCRHVSLIDIKLRFRSYI